MTTRTLDMANVIASDVTIAGDKTFSGDIITSSPLSHRNLIINGAMQVAERGTSFTGLTNGNEGYTLDRFRWDESGSPSAVCTVAQDSNAPDDFSNSLKVTVTTADTAMAASDHIAVEQRIEAQNLQLLNYGSSSAKSITLSFYVKSNKTGTYGIWFYQDDTSRSASYNYAISSVGTWERKSITIAGDTGGDGINNDNGDGLRIIFGLASGSNFTSGSSSWGVDSNATNRFKGHNVNVMDSTSNYWQITGVQLELGDNATPFEHRSFGDELLRCSRYFTKTYKDGVFAGQTSDFDGAAVGRNYNTSSRSQNPISYQFKVRMRTVPTITSYSPADGTSGNFVTGSTSLLTCGTEYSVTSFVDSESGITSLTSTSIGAALFFAVHLYADAEL